MSYELRYTRALLEWTIPRQVEILPGKVDGQKLLTDTGFGKMRRYEPLRRKTLHRAFAKVKTESQALAFVRENGFLFGGGVAVAPNITTHLTISLSPKEFDAPLPRGACIGGPWNPNMVCSGEPVAFYLHEAACLRAALNLFNNLRKKDVLRQRVYRGLYGTTIKGAPDPSSLPRMTSKEFPSTFGDVYLSHLWKRGDFASPVRWLLALLINSRLARASSSWLDPVRKEIRHQPENLRAAIWLLFAMEISGYGNPPIECAWCRRQFVPTTRRQKYCQPSCKVRACEERKRKRELST